MNTLHRRFVRLTVAGLIAAAMAVSACAEGIVPVHAEVSAIQDSSKAIYFDGSFELELAPEVKEVLERGVPLNFNLEVEIFKNRWYWFDREISKVTERIRLSYNPLTRQYRVSLGGVTQNFDNLDQAIFFMTTISKLYVAPYRDINPDDYEVRARFYLDTERLPKPFQVTLKKDDGWNLDSGWFDVTIVSTKE